MILRDKVKDSPEAARMAPFFIFLLLTSAPMVFGPDSQYIFYALKTLVGVWMIWEIWPLVPEMRWAVSWEAVVVGIGVCVMWVGINPYYPMNHIFFKPTPGDDWNPFARYGEHSLVAWFLACWRIFGMTFVVPPLEEIFYRSFLYRYFIRYNFLALPLNTFHFSSFLVTSAMFGFSHYQWLAGILCGFAYQWLVIRKNRLGDAMTAHAITNFLLGVWVLWKHDWQFF